MAYTARSFIIQTRLAFVLTTAGAVATVFTSPGPPLAPWRAAGVLIAAGAYAALGNYGDSLIRRGAPWPRAAGYLALQAAIYALVYALAQARGLLPIMMVPLVSHAVLSVPRYWAASAAALWGVMLLTTLLTRGADDALADLLLYAGAVLFGVFVSQIAGSEMRARAEVERMAGELRRSNEQLNAYIVEVGQLATARERNRLAREVHDTLGHHLTALVVQLEIVAQLFTADPPRAQSAAAQARALAAEGLAEVRRSVAALRPSPLEDRPLADAIRQLTDTARDAGLLATLSVAGEVRPLAPEVEAALYRAAQEALTNVRKHAHASAVAVQLVYQPQAVQLQVADNGTGRTVGGAEGVGLRGLRERAALLGGSARAEAGAGGGFVVEVALPDHGPQAAPLAQAASHAYAGEEDRR
jgi:signal transduction histidine kinase